MVEYESLFLGIEILKIMGVQNIYFCGYSELVIKKFEGVYQTKDVRMRAYRNLIMEMLEKFQ